MGYSILYKEYNLGRLSVQGLGPLSTCAYKPAIRGLGGQALCSIGYTYPGTLDLQKHMCIYVYIHVPCEPWSPFCLSVGPIHICTSPANARSSFDFAVAPVLQCGDIQINIYQVFPETCQALNSKLCGSTSFSICPPPIALTDLQI